jgi:hypothetical protein
LYLTILFGRKQNRLPRPHLKNSTKLITTGTTILLGNQIRQLPSQPRSLGFHANDILAQQKARAMHGAQPPVIPPSDPVLFNQFMMAQRQNLKRQNAQAQLIKEVVLNEVKNREQSIEPDYYASTEFKKGDEVYQGAKILLSQMLTGKTPLSLKDAFYILEHA